MNFLIKAGTIAMRHFAVRLNVLALLAIFLPGGQAYASDFDIPDALPALLAKRPPPPPEKIWRPAPGTTWQLQLTGNIDTSVNVQMCDIDLFDVPGSLIDRLHAEGRIVICYFMQSRLDLAVQKGCDGVEPDNVDGCSNNTGFNLSAQDQIAYNAWLAKEAHARNLSIGLKNDLDQVSDLLPYFDPALNEQCFQYDECAALLPFVQAGKAVFGIEYSGDPGVFSLRPTRRALTGRRKIWTLMPGTSTATILSEMCGGNGSLDLSLHSHRHHSVGNRMLNLECITRMSSCV